MTEAAGCPQPQQCAFGGECEPARWIAQASTSSTLMSALGRKRTFGPRRPAFSGSTSRSCPPPASTTEGPELQTDSAAGPAAPGGARAGPQGRRCPGRADGALALRQTRTRQGRPRGGRCRADWGGPEQGGQKKGGGEGPRTHEALHDVVEISLPNEAGQETIRHQWRDLSGLHAKRSGRAQ